VPPPAEEDFESWLALKLEACGLDTEIYSEYVTGLLADQAEEMEARTESVLEILSGALDEGVELGETFATDLASRWEAKVCQQSKSAASDAAEKEREHQERQQRDLALAAEHEEQKKRQLAKQNEMTREERLERNRILDQYGFSSDTVDEDGNIIASASGSGSAAQEDMTGVAQNLNRTRVKEAEQAKRVAARASHVKEQERIKAQQAKEKLKKEKEKQRTQKKERRPRG